MPGKPKTFLGRGFVSVDIIVNDAQTVALFTLMSARLMDGGLQYFLDNTMDPFVRARITARFLAEGDEVSGHWAPLRASTQAIRQKAGFPPDHPINVRTHMMMDFLTDTPGESRFGGGMVWMTWPAKYPNQEMVEKVTTAQGGKSNPRTPARPVLGLNENDNMFLQNELVKYILGI